MRATGSSSLERSPQLNGTRGPGTDGLIAGGVPLWEIPERQQRVVLDTDPGGVLALAPEGSCWKQVRHCVPACYAGPRCRLGLIARVMTRHDGHRQAGDLRTAEPLPPLSRALSNDMAAPDAVVADVPVLQRQFRALGACRTGDTDRDRVGGLAAGYFLVGD
jgi:hypothetical protein